MVHIKSVLYSKNDKIKNMEKVFLLLPFLIIN